MILNVVDFLGSRDIIFQSIELGMRCEVRSLYTIRDVARLAKVSTATVSFVTNGKGPVSEKLRLRVLAAMETLDYHPSRVARSLQAARTDTVGMVIPQIANPFFGEMMRGGDDEARKSGLSVIFCNSNENPELEEHHLRTLYERRVDGVILSSCKTHPLEGSLFKRRFPLVFVDRTPPGFSGTAVISNNLEASREATRHLITLGHRRIAIITGPIHLQICAERLAGFRMALQEACLPLPDEYIKFGDFTADNSCLGGREIMGLSNPPTAVFCCSGTMTLGLMRALSELKIPCPERVSVLSFDDFEWAASFIPRITAVAQPNYEMGRLAMEILVQKMQQNAGETTDANEKIALLRNELRIRESTAPPHCSSYFEPNPDLNGTHSSPDPVPDSRV
jgi:LacI family transcriptional regulator